MCRTDGRTEYTGSQDIAEGKGVLGTGRAKESSGLQVIKRTPGSPQQEGLTFLLFIVMTNICAIHPFV